MSKGVKIPFEVADSITLASLQDQYKYLKKETKQHLEKGQWMHPEDLGKNIQLINALELLIPYYGGEL
jgi:hypothetical protein